MTKFKKITILEPKKPSTNYYSVNVVLDFGASKNTELNIVLQDKDDVLDLSNHIQELINDSTWILIKDMLEHESKHLKEEFEYVQEEATILDDEDFRFESFNIKYYNQENAECDVIIS